MKHPIMAPSVLFVLIAFTLSFASATNYTEVRIPCDPECTKRGNCNIEEGRCECTFGFTGPTCEDRLLPSCHVSPSAPAFWGPFFPKSCACFQEVDSLFCDPQIGCQHSIVHVNDGRRHCFKRTKLPDDKQYSDLPAEGEQDVEWFTGNGNQIDEKEGRTAINLWGVKVPAHPLSQCPNRCSEKGSCITEHNNVMCSCHKGWHGHDCSQIDETVCFNKCSGRGKCERGFCHCEEGYFGIDCSRSKAYGPSDAPAPRTRLRIYAYELPSDVVFFHELDDNLSGRDGIYSSFEHFLSQFMQDWAVRTENPWEANMFYIPALTYAYSSNLGDINPHVKKVLRYVSTKFPFFNRTSGRDHFLLLNNDRGACYLRDEPELRHIIKLVHFGYNAKDDSFLTGVVNKDYGCYNPARDIVSMPYDSLGLSQANGLYADLLKKNGSDPERKNLFFFAGGVRMNQPEYSGGARQKVFEYLKDNKFDDVVFIEGGTPDYGKLMATTKFCLTPYGHGWGVRIILNMLHACIPVIIQDRVYQPFHDVLPYEKFSVRIHTREIPELIPILRAIPEEDVVALRMEMSKYYHAFVWEQGLGGQAYEYTIKNLLKRLVHMWAEHYKKQ